jgi:hypothetical protein
MKTIAVRILLICCSAAAYADTVEMKFTGVNGQNDGSYYVSPYQGTINGSPVALYCIDFAHEVYIGETWTANRTSLAGSDLSQTRFGSGPNAIDLYREAAWLTTQFASHPNDWVDLQHTLWQMFVPVPDAFKPSSDKWLKLAQANYADHTQSYDDFFVVTNVGVNEAGALQVQEFLVHTPEPAAIVLLATVALLAWLLLRRRLAARESA